MREQSEGTTPQELCHVAMMLGLMAEDASYTTPFRKTCAATSKAAHRLIDEISETGDYSPRRKAKLEKHIAQLNEISAEEQSRVDTLQAWITAADCASKAGDCEAWRTAFINVLELSTDGYLDFLMHVIAVGAEAMNSLDKPEFVHHEPEALQ